MSRKCQLTGRGPSIGHKISHAHNLTKRRWNINLQKVRVLVDGKVVKMRVSTKAIKSGLVEKPPVKLRARRSRVRKPQVTKTAAETNIEQEQVEDYFSPDSVVTRIFKPGKGKQEVIHGEEKFLVDDYNPEDEEDYGYKGKRRDQDNDRYKSTEESSSESDDKKPSDVESTEESASAEERKEDTNTNDDISEQTANEALK